MDDRVTDIKERLANPSGGMNVDALFLVLFAFDGVMVCALTLALSPSHALYIVPLVALSPILIFWLITVFLWKPMERRFPAAPQSRSAVVKLGQSVAFSRLMRFNNAMALAADEDHLHVIPIMPMRLTGAKVISIPWERMTDVDPPPGRFAMTLTRARLDGRRFAAPEWAMQFARVEPPGEAGVVALV